MPGSRKQEIRKMIPVFKSIINHFSNYEFIIAGVSNESNGWYREILKDEEIKIVCEAIRKFYNV